MSALTSDPRFDSKYRGNGCAALLTFKHKLVTPFADCGASRNISAATFSPSCGLCHRWALPGAAPYRAQALPSCMALLTIAWPSGEEWVPR